MALSTDDYLQQLQALLPQGPAWPREADALITQLLTAFSEEFSRVDLRIDNLVNEADPRTTNELLADWERVAGLPDLCTGIPVTIALRRELLVSKLTNVGGQSKQFYIDLASKLGYNITITEFKRWRVNSRVNEQLTDSDWAFVWRVNAQQDTVRKFTVAGRVNEPLASWGNTALECVITRLKPAHTHVQFAYS
jgi:uncharacterized protein YmfQ (DUF2313 family)